MGRGFFLFFSPSLQQHPGIKTEGWGKRSGKGEKQKAGGIWSPHPHMGASHLLLSSGPEDWGKRARATWSQRDAEASKVTGWGGLASVPRSSAPAPGHEFPAAAHPLLDPTLVLPFLTRRGCVMCPPRTQTGNRPAKHSKPPQMFRKFVSLWAPLVLI